MKILFVGSDRNLFKKDSDVWNRYLDYGKLFEEIHVIVFSAKKLSNKDIKIGGNVFIYPTNHICKLFYLWNVFGLAKKILVASGYWLITSQDPFESGLAAWMLKKIYKIPLQIQIHTDFLSPYFWQESFTNKLRVLLAKFLIPRADGIRVVSERIKQSLIRNWKLEIRNLKIDVLPIYIDIDKIKLAPIVTNLHTKYSQFDFIILMASRLTKEKNISLAIEAMTELVHPRTQELGVGVKKYPKLGLVIVGSGSEENNIKSSILNFKLENNVVLEPFVAQDTLFSYYRTADLFLLTSNYEGYGRTVIEAMAVGLPVVMTDVGLVRELVVNGENGVVVPLGDSGAIADSISSLINDESQRDKLIVNAIKTIEALPKKAVYLESYRKSFDF